MANEISEYQAAAVLEIPEVRAAYDEVDRLLKEKLSKAEAWVPGQPNNWKQLCAEYNPLIAAAEAKYTELVQFYADKVKGIDMKKKSAADYFSPEARDARRQARLAKIASVSSTLTSTAASRYAANNRLTTQNAGVKAVAMIRDVLNAYRLPGTPSLNYSGLRNGRTAANSSKLEDGVITVNASFRTHSNVIVNFDIPVEIRAGLLQEPSVIVHDGAPRVIAQSTFDDIVTHRTAMDMVPVREMYDAPFPKNMAKDLYSKRTQMPRVNKGMFSVGANKENLRAAIRGTAMKTAQVSLGYDLKIEGMNRMPANPEHPEWADYQVDGIFTVPGAMPQKFSAHVTHLPSEGLLDLVSINPPSVRDDDGEFSHMIEVKCLEAINSMGKNAQAQFSNQYAPAQQQPGLKYDQRGYQLTQPRPQMKIPYHPGRMYDTMAPQQQAKPQNQNVNFDNIDIGDEKTQLSAPHQPAMQPVAAEDDAEDPIVHEAGPKGTDPLKPPKPPKSNKGPKNPKVPKNMSAPKIKAPPQPTRLCSKCNHAPCVCPNKRKKKSSADVYRQIKTADDAITSFQPNWGFGQSDKATTKHQLDTEPSIEPPCIAFIGEACDNCALGGSPTSCVCYGMEMPKAPMSREEVVHNLNEYADMAVEYGDVLAPDIYDLDDPNAEGRAQFPAPSIKKRTLMSSDMVAKVGSEVDQMREQGLSDIDIKQAILKKYGLEIASSVFK